MTWTEIAALAAAGAALWRSRSAARLAARVAALERRLQAFENGGRAAPDLPPEEEESAPVTALPESPAAESTAPVPPAPALPENPWRPRSSPAAAPAARIPAPPLRIDWEQWVGVRGAAVLGGVVLALAGIFFFRYSIEHGLLPPWLRVVLGTTAGVSCLLFSERYLRRDYAGTANALVGAGIVILYASFWAAHGLYRLVGATPSFLAMTLVTATCSAFSWRQRSQVIALIGLVGGFLTPLLLSSGSDRPISLFSYVLVLDLGMLHLARHRRWPALALVSFAATSLYLIAWVGLRMGPQRVPLGLAFSALFAAVFVLAPQPADEERRSWLPLRIGGALLPFAFAAHFALRAHLGAHLYPLALSLLPMALAGAWLAEVHRRSQLGLGAAGAALGVVAAWLTTRHLDAALAWETGALVVVLAGIFHVFVERVASADLRDGPSPAALVSAQGGMLLLVAAGILNSKIGIWPWLGAWSALTLLTMRHGARAGRDVLQPLAAAVLAGAIFSTQLYRARSAPDTLTYLGIAIALASLFQLIALRRSPLFAVAGSDRAAFVFALLAVLSSCGWIGRGEQSPAAVLLGTAALGLLALFAATRSADARRYAAATVATAAVHAAWVFLAADTAADSLAVLAVELATALGFAFWPLAAAPVLRGQRLTWYAAAAALPLWFPALHRTFAARFGGEAIGLLPVALAAATLLAAVRARSLLADDEVQREHAFAWFVVVTLGFAGVAIPLQLSREWITLGWALEGAAAVWLWQRYDLPALKYFGLLLLGAATARLVANPAVLGYYPRPRLRIVNWLAYAYLVPAACLLHSAAVLSRLELVRVRPREASLYADRRPAGAIATGLAGLVVIFVWLNLAIADWFATGPTLSVSFSRLPARDLTTSVVWALYALGLLAAGVRFASVGLRWGSLGLLSITLVKVFLYDVGELRDLYRVASLLGLALSLISVSLVYQRFVFRRTEETK